MEGEELIKPNLIPIVHQEVEIVKSFKYLGPLIDEMCFNSDMPVEEYFDDADVYKYYSTDTQGEEDASDDSDTDSQLTPFAKLARKMKDITTDQDKGVLKDMLRQGTGNVVPSDAFVTGNLF